MNEFITIIMEHAAIWAPSLASIIAFVSMLIPIFIKCKDYLKTLKDDKTLIEVSKQLDIVIKENKDLIKCNRILIDELTKIKNYVDYKE